MSRLLYLLGAVCLLLLSTTTESGRYRAWSRKDSSESYDDSKDWYDSSEKPDYYKDSKPKKYYYSKKSKSEDKDKEKWYEPKPTKKPTKKPSPKPKPVKKQCYPGVIQGFFGKVSDIPYGFQLCDGSKGTPDLRDRFLVGSGEVFSFGDTGGAAEVTIEAENVPSHKHDSGTLVTLEAGEHNHDFKAVTNEGGHFHNEIDLEIAKNGLHAHKIDLKTEQEGDHNHKFDAFVPVDYGTSHEDFDVPLVKVDLDKSYPIEVSEDPGHQHKVIGETSEEGEHSHDIDGTIGGPDDGIHFHTVIGNTEDAGLHTHEIEGETGAVGGGEPIHILPPFYSVYWICCVEQEDKKYDWYKDSA